MSTQQGDCVLPNQLVQGQEVVRAKVSSQLHTIVQQNAQKGLEREGMPLGCFMNSCMYVPTDRHALCC